MIAIAADHDVPDMPVVSAVARVGCGAKPVFRRGGADRCAGEYATPGQPRRCHNDAHQTGSLSHRRGWRGRESPPR
jgi:hypothetical protein